MGANQTKNEFQNQKRRMTTSTKTISIALAILGVMIISKMDWTSLLNNKSNIGMVRVYQSKEYLKDDEMNRIRIMIESTAKQPYMKYVALTKDDQDKYMKRNGHKCHNNKTIVWEMYEKSSLLHQYELWKYCTLYNEGGVILGNDIVLLHELNTILSDTNKNYAVLNIQDKSIHSSSILKFQDHSLVASHMIHALIKHRQQGLDELLYSFIVSDVSSEMNTQKLQSGSNGHNWFLFDLKCPFKLNEDRQCTLVNGYCCNVSSNSMHLLVRSPGYDPPSTSNPYVTQIGYKTYRRPENMDTPNMFHLLMQNDCLPTDRHCHKCLRSSSTSKGSCTSCLHVCHCYCQILCKVLPEPKFISATYTITPPHYTARSYHYPNLLTQKQGLIPPIIHQTWFEEVSKEKYPNMSRLIQSFQLSGLKYKFYNDDDAIAFLENHFPPEVKEAYDALLPGAFKADLFRYCVLLIEGGIYADMDVLLQTNLHTLLTQQSNQDIGFLIPIDEPGSNVGHRMCLWNGFIASKPGHPILAKVIEIVVNNIRNRFTGVDYDTMFCPTPMLSVSHTVDMLLTTGPCILGYVINTLLNKHPQSSFEPGEISSPLFPGRTIILDQNKNDMGAHRFTFLDQNIIVAATDMPDYEDRPNQKSNHYSKTRVQAGVYGLDSLYKNDYNVDEEIRLEFA